MVNWVHIKMKRMEKITTILKSFCWLPVSYRINFKVLLFHYKSLNGLGATHQSGMLKKKKKT